MMEMIARRRVGLRVMDLIAGLIDVLHVHWYVTKRTTGRYKYRECRCGMRRIDRLPGVGYEPIDVWWLDGKNRPQLRTGSSSTKPKDQ